MDIEKIKYSKCPHCKKYGISAFRGISRNTTFVETCKYCGRRYRVNPALAFILTIVIAAAVCGIYFIVDTFFSIHIPNWVLGLLVGLSFLFSERYWPVDEDK